MDDIFSLRGMGELLRMQYEGSTNDTERVVINNVMNLIYNLYSQYGVDVLHKIPDDMMFLNNYENKIFSQFNEDGITEKIFNVIGFTDKFYVEFGGTTKNNNSEVLHKNHGFSGLLLNCDDTECDYTKIHTERVTAENIVGLFKKYNVPEEFDFLSIDIDYNDWYVWRAVC